MKLFNTSQFLFTVFLFLVSITNAFGQNIASKIDTSNYYDFYVNYSKGRWFYEGTKDNPNSSLNFDQTPVATAWLTNLDVTPIIIEELKLAGYKYPADNVILKNNAGQVLLVNAYCNNEKFGILYLQGHYANVSPKHRLAKTPLHRPPGVAYVERIFDESGKAEFINFEELPSGLLTLSEDCYWYQFSDSNKDNKKLVNKDIAIKILRSDIRSRLATAPKPIIVEEKPFVIMQQ